MKQRRNFFSPKTILTGKAPGPYLLMLIVVMILMMAIGYFGVTLLLNIGQNEEVITEEAADQEALETALTDSIVVGNYTLDSFDAFTVQVSSLSDQSSAEKALEIFAKDGIKTIYYQTGNQYKVVAGISLDKDSAAGLTKKLVEKYPKYRDSFSGTATISLGTVSFNENYISNVEVASFVSAMLQDFDQVIYDAYVSDEMDINKINKLTESVTEFANVLANTDQGFNKRLIDFNDNIKQLANRKANVGEYSMLWLNFLLNV